MRCSAEGGDVDDDGCVRNKAQTLKHGLRKLKHIPHERNPEKNMNTRLLKPKLLKHIKNMLTRRL